MAAAGCVLAVAILIRATAAVPAAAYADGAPPGFSGGFGEQSCDACHFDSAVNTRPGELTLRGVPVLFVPGRQYSITMALSRPGMRAGGIQVAARFADGTQAGTFAVGAEDGTRLKIESQGGIQYVNQRSAGTALSTPDRLEWTLMWTAPLSGGPVVFNAAGNAADGDESAVGDYVFTASAESKPQP